MLTPQTGSGLLVAKAQFQKGQKVWVDVVGAWAVIEKVAPVWAKGFDEPVRILYDVGLGRDFLDKELKAAERAEDKVDPEAGEWRLLRARNKWQNPDDCTHHPVPGTFPVVVTDPNDWGGWRTPGAEYDRDPHKIEFQARLIASTPKLLAIVKDLIELAAEEPEDTPPEVLQLAQRAAGLVRRLHDEPVLTEASRVAAA
jgi:hypothetical protein